MVDQVLRKTLVAAKTRQHYLSLVWLMVLRELKVKYRGTILGYSWSMLNPLLFMAVIAFVFSHLVRGIPNYPVFILAGMVVWNMVSAALIAGATALTSNHGLLTKVKVPLWIFPLVSIGFALSNLVLSLVPYGIVSLVMKTPISSQVYLLPLVIFLFAVFLLGLVLTLSVANVFFRDVSHVLPPVVTLVFYATPVIYNRGHDMLPERIRDLLGLNPFTHFVEAFRGSLFGDLVLGPTHFAILSALAVVSFVIGVFVYKSNKQRIMFAL